MLYDELGHELEAIAKVREVNAEPQQIEAAAFQAYRNAGDTISQFRLSNVAGPEFPSLFLSIDGNLPSRLAQLSAHNPERANSVVQYLIANEPVQTAAEAISVRGKLISPLWISSYTALAGLYVLSSSPSTSEAFNRVLGARTVDAQVADKQRDILHGSEWYYYAACYGDYLACRKEAASGEFLPASLESAPAAADSYVNLGKTYQDLGQVSQAMKQYRLALELSPGRSDVYDRLAILAIRTQQRSQAIDTGVARFSS